MLKRVKVEQLRPGMYVHELCGSWMDHPFWRSAFLLNDPKDLQTIQSTDIQEVWIDTAKGLDVEGGETAERISVDVEATLAQADMLSEKKPRVDIAQEAARAVMICSETKQAVP